MSSPSAKLSTRLALDWTEAESGFQAWLGAGTNHVLTMQALWSRQRLNCWRGATHGISNLAPVGDRYVVLPLPSSRHPQVPRAIALEKELAFEG